MKTTGASAEKTAHTVANAIGYELDELKKWNCCGTVFQLTDDAIMHHVGSIRNLIHTQEQGYDELTTLCAICYNTVKRVDMLYKKDPDKNERLKAFIDNEKAYKGGIEEAYNGGVSIKHFLELLKTDEAIEALKSAVKKPLTGLKVMPYYGCLLLRPEGLEIDDRENPSLMEKILRAAGAEPVQSPYRIECCGSFETVEKPEFVAERTYQIVGDSRKRGAQVIITACPLCQFNLDARQKDVEGLYRGFQKIPVLYFTQLLHIALGGEPDEAGFGEHYVDPRPALASAGLL
jgi:heterodisulfide reductase subunit B